MAVIIRHGPAGSYKSALIVSKHIIPALLNGEIVVTNVEGMYPLEVIKEKLKGKFDFPDEAKLIRIGSLTIEYQELWRNWFNWMPLGVKIIVDEIQDIYPTSFKKDLDCRPFADFESLLPKNLIECFHEQKDIIKASDFDEGDTDDTGKTRFTDDGHIQYPLTLNGAYKRHRKFNWDMVLGTPDINEVSAMIRGVAETAFVQRSRDSVPIFKRKPWIGEHNPKSNGLTIKKGFTSTETVPLWAFLCYKSTQTGKVTKSGTSKNPLKSPVLILSLLFGVICFGYAITRLYTVFFADDLPPETPQVVEPVPLPVKKPLKDGQSYAQSSQETKQINPNVSARVSLLSSASNGNSNLGIELPYSAEKIFLTGYAHPSIYIFSLTFKEEGQPEETFQINSDDLRVLGWFAKLEDDGLVRLRNRLTDQLLYVVFDPRSKRDEYVPDADIQQQQPDNYDVSFTDNALFSAVQ